MRLRTKNSITSSAKTDEVWNFEFAIVFFPWLHLSHFFPFHTSDMKTIIKILMSVRYLDSVVVVN